MRKLKAAESLPQLVCLACTALSLSAPAAETAGPAAIEEIIVSAQKREQSIQDIPMSISAMGGVAIERAGYTDVKEFANAIPSLTHSVAGGSQTDSATTISIRGVAGENTTGFYIDDAPLLESVNPRVIELERIEVLRGPQGTLYGARSMGGTVRLITRQPQLNQLGGRFHAGVSTTKDGGDNYRLDGTVNIPVAEDLFALQLSGFREDESGFLDRVASPLAPQPFSSKKDVNDLEAYGGQVVGLVSLLEGDLKIVPRYIFQNVERDGRTLADTKPSARSAERLFDLDEPSDTDWSLATLTISYETAFGQFVSATSGYERSLQDSEDFSEWTQAIFGVVLPSWLEASTDEEMFAQEFRFTSSFDGPLQLTAGLFYQNLDSHWVFPPAVIPGIADAIGLPSDVIFFLDNKNEIDEKAAFIEATYQVTDKLTFILGLRYFDNEVDFELLQGGSFIGPDERFGGVQKETGVTPKFGVQYAVNDNHMLYATAGKGFRTGGVNFFSSQLCSAELDAKGISPSQLQTFDSDELWSYELGLKSSLFDDRVKLNLSAYRIDWTELQQNVALACGFSVTANTGEAESNGFEAELEWQAMASLKLAMGIGYSDAEISDGGDLLTGIEGEAVQDIPEWTLSFSGNYDFALFERPAYLHADLSYTGDSMSAVDDSDPLRSRDSYTLANLKLGMIENRWELSLFVNNLFDEEANYGVALPMGVETPGRPRIAINRPRTMGIEARYEF